MNEIAIKSKQTMSSREIAELTGKEHAKVIADIKRVLDEAEIGDAVFRASYTTPQNKELPCYNLPKRECDLVIAGYSVKYRLAIIDRWHELESKTALPDFTNPAIAARAWADEVEAKQAALAQIDADKPKVDFALAVRNLDGSCEIGEFAALIGIGRNTLFKMLREDKILMVNNRPYQSYKDRGLFVEIENIPFIDIKGKSHPTFQTRVTGKGQVWMEKKFRSTDNQNAD